MLALGARVLALSLGGFAIAWGAYVIPGFWRHATIQSVAARIVEGQPFRLEALTTFLPALQQVEQETRCWPGALRSSAIIRFRLAEETLAAADRDHIDQRMTELRATLRRALSCNPSDSFLWLALYWVTSASEGLGPEAIRYLRMSYEQGPNEGWIIVKRNHAALAIFGRLPPDLAELVLDEFAKLIAPNLEEVAANIFLGPGAGVQDRLLQRIGNRPIASRIRFAQILQYRGVEVRVPGVELTRQRPQS